MPTLYDFFNNHLTSKPFLQRAFSAVGLYATKLRSRLGDDTLEDLFILKGHFEREDRILGKVN